MSRIVIAEYPKSGGTWIVSLLADVLNFHKRDIYAIANNPGFDFFRHPWYKNAKDLTIPENSVIKSHELANSKLNRLKASYFHLVRDGRDVTVSRYFYEKDFCVKNGIRKYFNISFDEYVEKIAYEWRNYVTSWLESETPIIRYEDFLNDPQGEIKNFITLLDCRNISDDGIRHAILLNTKDRTRKSLSKTFKFNTFVRKGISGDWKNHFSKHNTEKFEAIAGESLYSTGYECHNRIRQNISKPNNRNMNNDHLVTNQSSLNSLKKKKALKIVHVCTLSSGGAAKAALRLHKGLLNSGIDSIFLTQNTTNADPDIRAIPTDVPRHKILPALPLTDDYTETKNMFARWHSLMQAFPSRPNGLELFSDSISQVNLNNIQEVIEADIVHFHWVAGILNYSELPTSFYSKPVVWTLHDMNPFTGGCHYTGNCQNYKKQCGACPQLGSRNETDLSWEVWQNKSHGFRDFRHLTIVTPSRWLGDCVQQSSLMGGFPREVIPNGLPIDVFRPRSGNRIREHFDIPDSDQIILFGAADIHNARKGFRYLLEALDLLAKDPDMPKNLIVMVFGNFPINFKPRIPYPFISIGHVNDENLLSEIYSAADVFVLPSVEDNLPNTAVEAMACGTPVVGFSAGGITEIISHQKTGYLSDQGNPTQLADGIRWVLDVIKDASPIRKLCRKSAIEKYAHDIQVESYRALYQKALHAHHIWETDIEGDITGYISRGKNAFRQGDVNSSEKHFAAALNINNGHSETHNNLGVLYSHLGNLDKALYHHEIAHSLSPENDNFAKNFADLLVFTNNDILKAHSILSKLIETSPQDCEVLYSLGVLSQKQNQLETAKSYFDRLLSIDPDNESALRFIGNCNDIPDSNGSESTQHKFYAVARQTIADGHYSKAIEELHAIVKCFPNFAPAHNDLGALAVKQGNTSEALTHYCKATEIDPENCVYQKNLADYLFLINQDVQAALKIYLRLLEKNRYDTEILYAIGQVSIVLGRVFDAKSFFERVIEIEPNHASATNALNNIKQKRIDQPNISFDSKIIRVSAVVSTYASKRFIEGRLQNLIDQTLFKKGELEIIVIDSNSPENEKASVDQFSAQHPEIVYLRTPERETVYAAWNRGIEMARGTYCVNANTDDRFSPDALELMADALDAHPEYDAAYGNWVVTRTPNDTFESTTAKRLFVYPEFHPGLFFYLQITSHASFVRRSVIDKIGPFDGTYTVFGDREFMFRFSAAGHKALKLDKIVGLYLENPTSVERANKDIGMQECSALYNAYLIPEKFARLTGHDHDVSPKTLSRSYSEAGCFGMGLYQIDAKPVHALGSPTRLFAKAIELDPGNIEALNNMGVIAQYRQAKEDALRFLENAASQANDSQIKTIDHNQKMVSRGVSDPDQLRFLYPSDFRPMKVVESKYNSNSQGIFLGDNRSTYLKSKRPTIKKRQKKISRGKSLPTLENKKKATPSPLHCGPKVDDKIWPAWGDYLKGNHTSAQLALQQILTEHPNHWAAYELLVDVMVQSGHDMDIPNQLQDLENRSNLPARMMALIGHGYEASGNLEKAADFVTQALGIDSECARAWNLKGVITYRNGNATEAAQFFKKASECDGNWGDPWTNMGTLHWDHGAQDKALDCFETGFQLSPTGPNVATTYHIAISETGQYERARKVFEDVVSRYPNFRKGRFLLVDVLIRLEAYHAALCQIEVILVRFGTDTHLLEAAKAVRAKVGPLTIKKDKHPSLSLCMIVKNEEKYLPRCLESLKPIVDEMIVVDTGSTDTTRDIATVFGAKVYDYEWSDDFSAARNFSLEQTTSDWILVMDADEIIAPTDYKTLRALIRKHKKHEVAFSIVTRNYTRKYNGIGWVANDGTYQDVEAGCGWTPSTKVRLFKYSPQIRFEFPVHELVDPTLKRHGYLTKKCPVIVHHYGYLDLIRVNRKGEHYYEIGKKKLKEMGNNPIALQELAVQADLLDKHDEAIDLWNRLARIQPGNSKVYINLSAAYGKLGQYIESKISACEAIKVDPKLKEGYLNLGRSELLLGNFLEACEIFRKLVRAESNYYSALFMLGAAEICNGETDRGLVTIGSLKSLNIGSSLPHAFQDLARNLAQEGFHDKGRELLSCAAKLGIGKAEFVKDMTIVGAGETETNQVALPMAS